MDDDLEMARMQFLYGGFKSREGITSADIGCGIGVDRLKSQLHPYRLDGVQLREQCKHIIAQTVRTGTDTEGYHAGMPDRFQKERPQIRDGCIGVRVCLKISNELLHRAFFLDQCHLRLDLRGNRLRRIRSEVPGTSGTAEDTAAASQCTIPVRTGHTSV